MVFSVAERVARKTRAKRAIEALGAVVARRLAPVHERTKAPADAEENEKEDGNAAYYVGARKEDFAGRCVLNGKLANGNDEANEKHDDGDDSTNVAQ